MRVLGKGEAWVCSENGQGLSLAGSGVHRGKWGEVSLGCQAG